MQLTNSHLFDRKASFIGMKRTADQVPKTPTRLLTILKGAMFALVVMGTHALQAQDTLQLVRSFVRHDPQLSYFRSSSIPDSARFGAGVAAIGDIDQDGIPDMAIGMPHDSSDIKGVVLIMFMNADGTIRAHKKIRSNTDAFTVNLDPGDAFGNRVSGIGDLNNDGFKDIAVMATGDDDGATDQGALYILFLDTTATVLAYQKISDTAGGFTGTMSGGNTFGGALAPLGDLNGDGVTDLGVGAFLSNDGGGVARGALWVLLMNTNGTVSGHRKYSRASTWPVSNPLSANNINFGFACIGLGDIDGDGVNDIAVTARFQGNGRIYIMRLNADGTIKGYNTIGPPNLGGMTTAVTNAGGHFGWALANLGDLNNDGVVDILAAMRMQSDGYTNAGAVMVFYLNANGTVQYEEKISQTAGTGATPLGLHASSWFGFQVAALGDLDGDNVMDLAISSTGYDAVSKDCSGAVFILNLNPKPMIVTTNVVRETRTRLGKARFNITGGTRPFVFNWSSDIVEPDAFTTAISELDTVGLRALGMTTAALEGLDYEAYRSGHDQDSTHLMAGQYDVTIVDAASDTATYELLVGYELLTAAVTGASLASGEDLTKSASNGWTNMQFLTKNLLRANEDGFMVFRVPQINKKAAAGFRISGASQVNGYEQMKYAFLLSGDSIFIWKNSTSTYSGHKYTAGAHLRIDRSDNTIQFRKNGTVIHTITGVDPTELLVLDICIHGNAAQIMDIVTDVPASFTVNAARTAVGLLDPFSGSVTLTPEPALGTFTYAWSGGGTGATKSDLPAGDRNVSIISSQFTDTIARTIHIGNRIRFPFQVGYTDTTTVLGHTIEREPDGADWSTALLADNRSNGLEGDFIRFTPHCEVPNEDGILCGWFDNTSGALSAAWWVHGIDGNLIARAIGPNGTVGAIPLHEKDELHLTYSEGILGFGLNDRTMMVDTTTLPDSTHTLLTALHSTGSRISALSTSLAVPLRLNTNALQPDYSYAFTTPDAKATNGSTGQDILGDMSHGPDTGDYRIELAATDTTIASQLLFEMDNGVVLNMRLAYEDTLYVLDTVFFEVRNGAELVLYDEPEGYVGPSEEPSFTLSLDRQVLMTPDGDLQHDTFLVSPLIPDQEFLLTITDAASMIVFQTEDESDAWTGLFMNTGALVARGTYTYELQLGGSIHSGLFMLNY